MGINKNCTIIASDSGDDINLPSSWLPGGTMFAL